MIMIMLLLLLIIIIIIIIIIITIQRIVSLRTYTTAERPIVTNREQKKATKQTNTRTYIHTQEPG
jgi:uncharacterized protein YpmB